MQHEARDDGLAHWQGTQRDRQQKAKASDLRLQRAAQNMMLNPRGFGRDP